MSQASHFGQITRGPAYAPTAQQMARDYVPSYPERLPERPDSVRLLVPREMVRASTPSKIHDVTDAQRQQAIDRRRGRPRSALPKPAPAPRISRMDQVEAAIRMDWLTVAQLCERLELRACNVYNLLSGLCRSGRAESRRAYQTNPPVRLYRATAGHRAAAGGEA